MITQIGSVDQHKDHIYCCKQKAIKKAKIEDIIELTLTS